MSILKDRRRILGPTDSIPVVANQHTKRQESDRMRAQDEVRKLFIQRGIVSNSTGSAYIEVGDLRLQCSVNGPKPIRGSFTQKADLSVEVQFSRFSGVKEDENESRLTKNIASFLQTSLVPSIMLELYPKSAISILLSVISFPEGNNLKSLLSAATSCASVALADSGISVTDIVTSGSVLLHDGQIYSDPECESRDADDVEAVVSYMCATTDGNDISAIWLDGSKFSPEEMDVILKQTKSISVQTRQLINNVLIEGMKEKE